MIELTTTTAATTVTVAGDLDVSEREQFAPVVARVDGLDRPLLVLDLCATDFVDSAGAGLLVTLAELVGGRGGTVVLRGADDRALFVLDLMGALPLFGVDEEHFCVDPAADGRSGESVLDGAGLEVPVVPPPISSLTGGSLPGA